ncbi:MAG: hypothetical protein JHC95_10880 [Solirubrobacteraceae bacterium]|nr:hypothetical protein [Solirubrobacteraceae bacterium]
MLFVGNSMTYVNDTPTTLDRLARSGGKHVAVRALAVAGARLADHLARPESFTSLRASSWDVVVLQEQSQIPAIDAWRKQEMYPAARRFAAEIRTRGARPLLYETAGYRRGSPELGLRGYRSMQLALARGYAEVGTRLGVEVAPAGTALLAANADDWPALTWEFDGHHPGPASAYAAACVFYARIFRESPRGLRFHGGLPAELAARLQESAARLVLGR